MPPKKTLVIGWFSFELMGSTAGDVIAKDIACDWLREIGIAPDVAVTEPRSPEEVATTAVVPAAYDTVVFVCGPIGDGPPLNTFLAQFPHARKFALNVSLLQERADWNPFVAIVERDSSERTNPDITLCAQDRKAPVIGLILVGSQKEYPTNRHAEVEKAFAEVLAARDAAVVRIDTRLDVNEHGLSSAAQIESLIAKMDAVLTTRLHGAVLALRRGVPPVVVDSVPGGTKLLRQMRRLGWPLSFDVAQLRTAELAAALDRALTAEARQRAVECAQKARADLAAVKAEFLSSIAKARGTAR